MSLKLDFVERASMPGAQLAPLCREFGISRQTGHKWMKRYRERGYDGLEEQSRRPKSAPLATAEDVVVEVIQAREAHPRWGALKLSRLLRRKLGPNTPSRATVARILARLGLLRARRRRPQVSVVERAPEIVALACNDVWTIDFKGSWRSRDRTRCDPLTVRDAYSRYVLLAKLLRSTSVEEVRKQFEALFRKYGIPRVIQCDNGPPFICVQARGGLSRLSAWFVSLGIRLVRSRTGCPQDNGGHERMHRDISDDVEAFPAATWLAQQRALDRWRQEFNHVRPHEALEGKTPAELYRPGTRRSMRPVAWPYNPHWLVRRVSARDGVVSVHGVRASIGKVLVGQRVGLEPVGEGRYRAWFCGVDLGELRLGPSNRVIEEVSTRLLAERGGRRRKAA